MHYKDGARAEVGDVIRFPAIRYEQGRQVRIEREGILISVSEGTGCNGEVACLGQRRLDGVLVVGVYMQHVALGECGRAEVPVLEPVGARGGMGRATESLRAGDPVVMRGDAVSPATRG